MTGPKLKSAVAVAAAVLAGLALLPVSYLLTPQPNQNPLPMPVPSVESQIFSASMWIGFAALVSFSTVGLFVLVQRAGKRHKNSV